MANKHAEVCGKLFASERAVSLCRAHNEDLLSKLHSSTDQADTRQAEQAAETERLRAELYEALAGRAEANQALAAKEARLASLMQDPLCVFVAECMEVRDLHICTDGLRQKAQEAEKRAEASTARCATLEKEVREVPIPDFSPSIAGGRVGTYSKPTCGAFEFMGATLGRLCCIDDRLAETIDTED
eukprot:s2000_g1.t1